MFCCTFLKKKKYISADISDFKTNKYLYQYQPSKFFIGRALLYNYETESILKTKFESELFRCHFCFVF